MALLSKDYTNVVKNEDFLKKNDEIWKELIHSASKDVETLKEMWWTT